MSVEGLPPCLKSLHADNCVSLERVQLTSAIKDPIRELMFSNCLRLDEKATKVIISHRFAKYVCLSGRQVPAEFTHKATLNSITIPLGNSSSAASSRFKACLLLSPVKNNALLHVICYLRSEKGVLINHMNYLSLTSDEPPQVGMEHLFILRGDLLHEQIRNLEVDLNARKILFEFTCSDNHKIIECGVRILKEEGEKRDEITECWLQDDQINIGDNTNDHTEDHNDDEPEAVGNISNQTDKAEAVEVENVESTKHTGFCYSVLRKLGLGKKKTKSPL
ncbi:unnamed protein product [Arabis nemorensis]|uniref:C-JID domain-containing protein n=1 Tax=Arabis nemorensis TaxID=586526 RepID=A0A565C7G8_9BRAS|nr:unnamed protein product [Arabis nemorensis]